MQTQRTVAAIAAASLLAAFAAQANKGAEYKPHHKEHHKNFFITGGATYLEPSQNMLDYLDVITLSGAPGSAPSIRTETLEPSFDWGYYLAAGYRISHHYDVQASWAQFNSNLSDSTVVNGAAGIETLVLTSNGVESDVLSGASATASTTQSIDFSVFDATLGQYHDITEMLRARLFVGVRYAKVDTDTDNTYDFPLRTNPALMNEYDSSFSGVGPEAGLDLEYKIYHRFGVVSHLAAAFLVGQQDTDSFFINGLSQIDLDTDSETRLIPALDAKLGLNWNVPYETKWNFEIEGGYQVAYYFDVIDQVTNTDGFKHHYSDYGNMGPYLNLTAMF